VSELKQDRAEASRRLNPADMISDGAFFLVRFVQSPRPPQSSYIYKPSGQREKDTIATSAGEIAGKDKVDNQLEVKAANK